MGVQGPFVPGELVRNKIPLGCVCGCKAPSSEYSSVSLEQFHFAIALADAKPRKRTSAMCLLWYAPERARGKAGCRYLAKGAGWGVKHTDMTFFPPFPALSGRKLHLGVCGSVAAYKAVEIMRALQKADVQVSVTLTDSACRFLSPLLFSSLGADPVFSRMFGQDDGTVFGHLRPGTVSDAMLVAPATATTLAKLATGLADTMLAAQALAFAGPLVLAPAMNPGMWSHPATRHTVQVLHERGSVFVLPVSGQVACGVSGEGRLAEISDILFLTARALIPPDLAGKTFLVTLGPTREPWDDVRIWTNRSTGRMGAALAQAAFLRGAAVHAVAGPGSPPLPAGIHRLDVCSAAEMFDAAASVWDRADYGLFTAAVADFSPQPFGPGKGKKSDRQAGFSIAFTPNRDILATLAAKARHDQKILGFAAESGDLEQETRAKLLRKKCHLMAGNLLGQADAGFASPTNRLFVCDYRGREDHWPLLPKEDVAWRLLDWLSLL
jgi:phosphopantothenoylcysteine decarboxylase/phosphopantothenate--cysteine ligase